MQHVGDVEEEKIESVEQELLRQSERASRLMLQGDLLEAQGVATRALSINPKHVPSACALARILCRKGTALHDGSLIQQAEHLMRTCLEHAPDDPGALFFLGRFIWLQGQDIEQASALIAKALANDPLGKFLHPLDPPLQTLVEQFEVEVNRERSKRICQRFLYKKPSPRQPFPKRNPLEPSPPLRDALRSKRRRGLKLAASPADSLVVRSAADASGQGRISTWERHVSDCMESRRSYDGLYSENEIVSRARTPFSTSSSRPSTSCWFPSTGVTPAISDGSPCLSPTDVSCSTSFLAPLMRVKRQVDIL
uniref:Tetratricopeptide repeat protein n=1 Tax=Hanusia phi TaxID=3032 RepID=A0A7S0I427_9CRYP|mmetsp:Transcript_958/g.2126  ORF Transcript_958/g.2126 Transcript_958/m.2126 type:complete len:309 (+) Transcript_958:267-1193(+)